MKIIAINGSPRKNWNTATLLHHALEGAGSVGAETELIHLYDLNYKGCLSCFACKLKGGKSYGRCAFQDDLTPLLKKVEDADALILGAPNYMGTLNGMTQAFIERLVYPHLVYDADFSSLFPKQLPTGFIYTFGAAEDRVKQMGYDRPAELNQAMFEKYLRAPSEFLLVTDTYQFDDHSRYETSGIDVAEKLRVRRDVFPGDCQKAYALGGRVVQAVNIN